MGAAGTGPVLGSREVMFEPEGEEEEMARLRWGSERMFQTGEPQTRAGSLLGTEFRAPPPPQLLTSFSSPCSHKFSSFLFPQPQFPHLAHQELGLHLREPCPGPVACCKHMSLINKGTLQGRVSTGAKG